MIKGAFVRQWKKMLMIALTIALGASLATAMLNVMMDVEDKVNQELKTYGANITVSPKNASILQDLYDVEGQAEAAYLKESELGKIKTIFWANNIVDFAPFLETDVALNGEAGVKLVGTWFNHHLSLPTGEELDAGVTSLRSWWDIAEGEWLDEQAHEDDAVMVGAAIAARLGLHAGDTVTLTGGSGERTARVAGVFDAGGDEDDAVYAPLHMAQALADAEGLIGSIEVSALTTPDNELAIKAAQDPGSLSISQYELWYCTAYVSSICYQIMEAIPDCVASAVRQVADSEGEILEKTKLLMVLITVLSLIGSALGITNLVTASVMERSQEMGLMKAVGAHSRSISGLVLTEIIITAIVGGAIGYGAGFGFAQVIGHSVFGSAIEMKLMVVPIVAVLVILVSLAGSVPAIRSLLKLDPAEVLHGH